MMRLHHLPMLCALLAPVTADVEPVFDAFGHAPASNQSEPDFSAFQKQLDDLDSRLSKLERAERDRLVAATAPPPTPVQLWRVPGDEWMTEADLRRAHPTARFPHDAPAKGVAGVDPFTKGSGGTTTPITGATGAGTKVWRPASSALNTPTERTFTLAPAGTPGGTESSCANGNCAAPTSSAPRRGIAGFLRR